MKKSLIAFLLPLLTLVFSSCKKNPEDLDATLFGTWNVTRVEGQQYVNGSPGLNLADDNPSGTIRFDDNGKGNQNYSFTIFGVTRSFNDDFRWEADSLEIRVDRFNQPDMIWKRKVNQPNLQKATYNIEVDASQNWDYTLTLEK